jgi:hypothetical protein
MDPSGYTILIWSEIIILKLRFRHVMQFCCVVALSVGSACRGFPICEICRSRYAPSEVRAVDTLTDWKPCLSNKAKQLGRADPD